jgi:hypothetical protein
MERQYDLDTIKKAQKEMRESYMNGSGGVIVSGLVWLTSAGVTYSMSVRQGMWTLLIGGALIVPLSIIVHKMMGVKGSHSKENALGNLAMEGTIFMLMMIPIAFVLSLKNANWFFQAMLLIIGGRYLGFQTIYGNKVFWILGGLLGIAGYFLFVYKASATATLITGGMIEIIFGIYLFLSRQKSANKIPKETDQAGVA